MTVVTNYMFCLVKGQTEQLHSIFCTTYSIHDCVADTAVFDVRESVHRDTIVKMTNKMQLYRLIYYSKSAVHVSGDVFAHNQEHLTVFTVSGSVRPSCCRLVSWMS